MKGLPGFLVEADELEKAHKKLIAKKDPVALGLAMRMGNTDHLDDVADALAKKHSVSHTVEDTDRVTFDGSYKGIAALRRHLGFHVGEHNQDSVHDGGESTHTHFLEHADGDMGGFLTISTNHNSGETHGYMMVMRNED